MARTAPTTLATTLAIPTLATALKAGVFFALAAFVAAPAAAQDAGQTTAQATGQPVPVQWTLDRAEAERFTPLPLLGPVPNFATPLPVDDAPRLSPIPRPYAGASARGVAIPVPGLGGSGGAVTLGIREHLIEQRLTHLGSVRRGEAVAHPDAGRHHTGRTYHRTTSAGAGLRLAF